MALSSQSQFLVSVGSIDLGYFETFTGGDAETPGEKRFDGGAVTPSVVFGRTEFTDIVIGRSYDPGRDQAIIDTAYTTLGTAESPDSITVQPTNARFEPVGPSTTWLGYMKKVTPPEVDSNSSTPASWKLDFMVIQKIQ